MLERIRESWRRLRQSAPGRRFQDRYERNRGAGARPLAALARAGLGVALTLLGLLMLFTPGPGVAALAVGAAILAGEFRTLARLLDWGELKARAAIDRARGRS